jgi:hypothetical protein
MSSQANNAIGGIPHRRSEKTAVFYPPLIKLAIRWNREIRASWKMAIKIRTATIGLNLTKI